MFSMDNRVSLIIKGPCQAVKLSFSVINFDCFVFTARKRSLGQGNIFRSVCQGILSTGGHAWQGGMHGGGHVWGGGGHVWQGRHVWWEGMHGGGCAWQGGMHGRGACVAGGHAWQGSVHGLGHALQGGVWWGGGACLADTLRYGQ